MSLAAAGPLTDSWDEVWAEYDRRQAGDRPSSPAPRAPALPRPAQRAPRLARRLTLLALLGLSLLLAGTYAAMPLLAARTMAEALAGDDRARVRGGVDWAALRQAMGAGMAAPLSGAGGSEAFLHGLAQEISGRLATPEGFTTLLRRRLGLTGGGPAPGTPLPRLEPLGLTAARAVFAGPGGEAGGVALTLQLRDPLRLHWQVVGIELRE